MQQLFVQFKKLIDGHKLSRSYLFFGDKQRAFEFAVSLLSFLEKKNKSFESGQNLIDSKIIHNQDSKIGLHEAKETKRFLYQMPISSSYRAVLVCPAENLTKEASNALLKITEELPERGLIIFIASSPYALFPTLASRLTKIYFSPIKERKVEKQKDLLYSKIYCLKKDICKNYKKLNYLLKREFYLKKFNLNKKLQEKAIEKIQYYRNM